MLSLVETLKGSVTIMTTFPSNDFNSRNGTIWRFCLWISICPMEYTNVAFLAIESSASEYSTFSGSGKYDKSKLATAIKVVVTITDSECVGGCYSFVKRKLGIFVPHD